MERTERQKGTKHVGQRDRACAWPSEKTVSCAWTCKARYVRLTFFIFFFSKAVSPIYLFLNKTNNRSFAYLDSIGDIAEKSG